jgi:hypothetical protein
LAFFERFRLRVAGIFLTEALVTLGAVSWAEGSSTTIGEVEGAAVVSFGSSSSSLQEETCYVQHERKRASMVQSQNSKKTYNARRSKYSMSSSRTGALSATVLWREILKEVKSSTRFLFLSTPVSSESVAGGDVIELVSSSDSLASSPS